MQRLAKFIFRARGWRMTGELPDLPKAVFIAAYHTSNWDGFWFITYKFALKVNVRFLAKQSLFWWPFSIFLTRIGAMPIDRSRNESVVQQLVHAFDSAEHLFLALAPEGTRKTRPYWKSGFYQIAKAAKVPVVLAYIDYARKEVGIGPQFYPGDVERDLEFMRNFYAGVTPKHEHLKSHIAFAPE